MKVGDKLYCYNNHIDYDDTIDYRNLTIGKFYEIKETIKTWINIIDDNDNKLYFGTKRKDFSYKKWFYTENELRKYKLKEVNDNTNI